MTDTNDILKKINDVASEIKLLYKSIEDDINIIYGYKSKIPLKGESFDDYKFYMGLIDNLYFYYKKSSEVRLNKLSRDIKEHCKVINLHELLPYDIFFSEEYVRKITEMYVKKISTKSDDLILNKNKYYWMKDNDVNRYDEWPKKLFYLLKYHKLVINFLHGSLVIEHNFLKAQKNDTINIIDKNFDMSIFDNYNIDYINSILCDPNLKDVSIKDGWFQSQNKKTIEDLQNKNKELKDTLKNRNSEFLKEKESEIEEIKLTKDKEKEEQINAISLQKDEEMNNLKSSINDIINELIEDTDVATIIQKIREKIN